MLTYDRVRCWVMLAIFAVAASTLLLQSAAAQEADRKSRDENPAIPPTYADVKYGPHERNVMDVWLAKSDKPTPVLIAIHGGGFRRGDKSVSAPVLKGCLGAGISVVAITYRLTPGAIAPAQHQDAARAVQFVRHNAAKWNLDPKRVAATGGSAGAGISLWLGFHEDMADPKSADPVLRESTRLTCMAVNQAQSSYDPRFIRDLFPESDTYRNSALTQLFDADLGQLDNLPAEKYQLFEEISALTHLTADDPPVLMTYDSDYDTPITDRSIGIHHPRFGKVLKERMDKLGIDCAVHTGFKRTGDSRSQLVLAFLRKQLKVGDESQGQPNRDAHP